MTTGTRRNAAIRAIASSLVFDHDPPIIRSLDKARAAAGGVVDTLVGAGILDAGLYGYQGEPAAAPNGDAGVTTEAMFPVAD